MNHGSLFSGIGGFDLAAEWMGWENIFHCEWMPFPRQVLHYHFPNSISYEDITKTDFTIHRGTIDILTGGFPCQPYSQAGKRLGKDDERHLWPHMLRAIQEIEPTFVVGENVRGLTNWNGGVVFEEVCADLENCGYEVQPILLPACAIGAPHRRDRIWFIAKNTLRGGCVHGKSFEERNEVWQQRNISARDIEWICRESNERTATNTTSIGFCSNSTTEQFQSASFGTSIRMDKEIAPNTNNIRLQYTKEEGNLGKSKGKTRCERSEFTKSIEANGGNGTATNTNVSGLERRINKTQNKFTINGNTWDIFPTQSPICGGDDGLPSELDGITFSKWRQESIKGYGNAIVPQVAYEIFKTIEHLHNEKL